MTSARGQAASVENARAQRREALLDAALRAIARRGPDVPMQEIAAEAGVTKPILYRHFGDQAGLAAALAGRFASMLTEALPRQRGNDPRARARRQIDAVVRVVEAHPHFYEYLTQQFGFGRSAEQSLRNAEPLVTYLRGLLADSGRDESLAEPWAHAVIGMIDHTLRWWVRTRGVSRRRLVSALDQLLWEGLGTPDSGR